MRSQRRDLEAAECLEFEEDPKGEDTDWALQILCLNFLQILAGVSMASKNPKWENESLGRKHHYHVQYTIIKKDTYTMKGQENTS